MAESHDYGSADASDIARYGVDSKRARTSESEATFASADGSLKQRSLSIDDASPTGMAPSTSSAISLDQSDALAMEEARALHKKVAIWALIIIALFIPSLGIFGANSDTGVGQYVVFSPVEVLRVLFDHVYNFAASSTHLFAAKSTQIYGAPLWSLMREGVTGIHLYVGVETKMGILGVTLICAVLLSVSGMLYQNVFKNPIAGPGMLGVSSGVSLGMMILVYVYGADALSLLWQRYALCYGIGAAILLFVIVAGRKLSGKGRPFDIVTMLLIGTILSQLIGFVVTYVTMFVMDPDMYQIYITLSQMLVVDTSAASWVALLSAAAVSLAPVIYLRFRFNALSFDEQEVKMLGINFTALRAVALVCGAIMILAAQIHIGAVSMVSLIVPFMSRSWFGCEFRKQLVGNVCISTVLMLVCRDIVDLIPFVGDGIGIGSAVSLVALPVFLLIMARHMRGWE